MGAHDQYMFFFQTEPQLAEGYMYHAGCGLYWIKDMLFKYMQQRGRERRIGYAVHIHTQLTDLVWEGFWLGYPTHFQHREGLMMEPGSIEVDRKWN